VAQNKNHEREAREARERLKRYNARQSVHAHQIKRRKRDNIYAIAGVLIIAAIAATTQIFYFSSGPGAPTPEPSASATPSATPTAEANVGDIPSPDVAEARTWTGDLTLNDTKLGIELDGAAAPQAVASFVTDSNDGYYIDKTCHRLVDDPAAGLIQCGSVDGVGGEDDTYSYGPIENAATDGVYPAGTIAMARIADKAYSQGHQFFIVFADAQLPDDTVGGYTIIGKVTSGLAKLEKNITDAGVAEDGTAPVTPTTITALSIQ